MGEMYNGFDSSIENQNFSNLYEAIYILSNNQKIIIGEVNKLKKESRLRKIEKVSGTVISLVCAGLLYLESKKENNKSE